MMPELSDQALMGPLPSYDAVTAYAVALMEAGTEMAQALAQLAELGICFHCAADPADCPEMGALLDRWVEAIAAGP